MQRVSGLYGNGVLMEDPTDRAAAANQRMATDIWSAKQGYEWGKEARGQASQEAMARLALLREQMGQQADLTREGWGREDARSKSYYDYLSGRDKTLDARMAQQRQWMLEDETRQRGYDAPRIDLETQRLKAEMELFGLQLAKARKDATRANSVDVTPPIPVENMTPEERARYNANIAGGADPYSAGASIVQERRTNILADDVGSLARSDLADKDTERSYLNPMRYLDGKTDQEAANDVVQPFIERGGAMLRQLISSGVPQLQAKQMVRKRLEEMLGPPTDDNKGAHRLVYQTLGL